MDIEFNKSQPMTENIDIRKFTSVSRGRFKKRQKRKVVKQF